MAARGPSCINPNLYKCDFTSLEGGSRAVLVTSTRDILTWVTFPINRNAYAVKANYVTIVLASIPFGADRGVNQMPVRSLAPVSQSHGRIMLLHPPYVHTTLARQAIQPCMSLEPGVDAKHDK